MMAAYKMFGKDQAQFCQNLYYVSDAYYESDRKTSPFLKHYHECLMAAGQPRGQQYCDDTFGLDQDYDVLALFNCYDTYNVEKILYAEEKCLIESPPIFGTEQCVDDLTFVDANGNSCATY